LRRWAGVALSLTAIVSADAIVAASTATAADLCRATIVTSGHDDQMYRYCLSSGGTSLYRVGEIDRHYLSRTDYNLVGYVKSSPTNGSMSLQSKAIPAIWSHIDAPPDGTFEGAAANGQGWNNYAEDGLALGDFNSDGWVDLVGEVGYNEKLARWKADPSKPNRLSTLVTGDSVGGRTATMSQVTSTATAAPI
jgi:hypothetical protein